MWGSGFSAARWICCLAVVEEGISPFWMKRQKWFLRTFFWNIVQVIQICCGRIPTLLTEGQGHPMPRRSLERDWTLPEYFQPFLAFPQSVCRNACHAQYSRQRLRMSGSLRPWEAADVSNQNVTLIRVMRCLREYFGLCHLKGKNYLFCTLGILFIWTFEYLQLKPFPISYPEKKGGDFSLLQWWCNLLP